MWRAFAGIIAGLFGWFVIVTILNFGLRVAIPGYHGAEASLHFTMAMKIGRLAEAAVTSLAAGALTARAAPSTKWAPWVVGLTILAVFLPVHIQLWDKFPPWYHLTFLVPIVPLVVLGAALAGRRERSAA